ncbi:MAG: hypothetical protein K1V90_05650 [Muribaculaceae bacterium]
MLFEPKDEDQDRIDYFDSADVPEEPKKEPKRPTYKPDDPAYWDEEESEWEHLRPKRKLNPWLWIAGVFCVCALALACWLRYFSPYVEDATQYGYVENIEKRGTIFKTFEGVLIPYKEITDTTRIYSRDFIFTAETEKLATALKRAQFSAQPVRIGYKRYHAIVPWRGSSRIIVTSVDSVDPSKILPPEFAPHY